MGTPPSDARRRWAGLFLALLGVGLVVSGILLNPWLLGGYARTHWRIVLCADLAAVLLGASVFLGRGALAERAARVRPLAVLLYLLYLAVVFEAVSRVMFLFPVFRANPYSSGSRMGWIAAHRKPHPVDRVYNEHDPLLGWKPKAGMRGAPAFAGKSVSIDSKGLRGTREYAYERTPGVPRVLLAGDSFTFGDDAGDDETYPHFLQRLLPRTEVVNLGVYAYGNDQVLLRLREEGVRYGPDIVVFGIIVDDMHRNLMSFFCYAKPRFVLSRSGGLRLTGVPVPTAEELLRGEKWRLKSVDLVLVLKEFVSKRLGGYQRRKLRMAEALFDASVQEVRRIGARPMFVYLNELRVVEFPEEEFVRGYCASRGVPFLSMTPAFRRAAREGVILAKDGHFLPRENEVVAREVAEFLRREFPSFRLR